MSKFIGEAALRILVDKIKSLEARVDELEYTVNGPEPSEWTFDGLDNVLIYKTGDNTYESNEFVIPTGARIRLKRGEDRYGSIEPMPDNQIDLVSPKILDPGAYLISGNPRFKVDNVDPTRLIYSANDIKVKASFNVEGDYVTNLQIIVVEPPVYKVRVKDPNNYMQGGILNLYAWYHDGNTTQQLCGDWTGSAMWPNGAEWEYTLNLEPHAIELFGPKLGHERMAYIINNGYKDSPMARQTINIYTDLKFEDAGMYVENCRMDGRLLTISDGTVTFANIRALGEEQGTMIPLADYDNLPASVKEMIEKSK